MPFVVLRDSDIELEEEAEDLVQTFENLLKRRRRGHVIRLEIAARMAPELRRFVIDRLEVGEPAVFIKKGLLGFSDISQLIVSERPDLLFKPFNIPLSGTRARVRRQRLCDNQSKEFRSPSSLRII